MSYSPKEKRKIILNNFNNPIKQVALAELKKISESYQIPFATFHSLEGGCGDIIHLLIVKKNNYFEKCLFSAQQSCLITVAAANILCSFLEKKDLSFGRKILNNCQVMIEGKSYNLDNFSDFKVFSDIFRFPHRVECLKLVIRGISKIISELSSLN